MTKGAEFVVYSPYCMILVVFKKCITVFWKNLFSRLLMSSFVLVASSAVAFSQEVTDSVAVFFRQGKSYFDPAFRGNDERVLEFAERINRVLEDTTFVVREVRYVVGSSPEGSIAINARLTKERTESVTEWLKEHIPFADSTLRVSSVDEDWQGLHKAVVNGAPFPYSDEALAMINSIIDGFASKRDLMQLRGGQPWAYMLKNYFPSLRRFMIRVTIDIRPELIEVEDTVDIVQDTLIVPVDSLSKDILEIEVIPEPEPVVETEPETEPEPEPEPVEEPWVRKLTLKTNMAGWAVAVANAGIEIDIVKNFSFHLPIYYSGVDYFTSTVKFRILALQPEFRYYIPKVEGLFVGAHFTMAYFNFAVNGNYRIQDRNGRTPMLGGGVSLGYRLHFRQNPRWGMEFALGAGAYRFAYDRFVNEKNGPLVNTVNKTYIGPDNIAISFTYDFDLPRKGAKKAGEGEK